MLRLTVNGQRSKEGYQVITEDRWLKKYDYVKEK